jgi:hypothetical protein
MALTKRVSQDYQDIRTVVLWWKQVGQTPPSLLIESGKVQGKTYKAKWIVSGM